MSDLMILAPISAVVSLLFAGFLAVRIKKFSSGTEMMVKIATAIKRGAKAYLKRQYKSVGIFFAVMFAVLLALSFFGIVNRFAPYTFIIGGFCSGLTGFIGMSVATSANSRTAYAASDSLNKGLRVAFSSGAVMGFTVVGLALLPLSAWYYTLQIWFNPATADGINNISAAMLTFGMGASSLALFARVGGGIFTKAADVGADLVGKVEAGIPEDDPRNPAVIADNVGDNVGDVAGMGADLYESYIGAIVSAASLAVAAGLGIVGMVLPLVMAGAGILVSIFGTFFVRSGEKTDQKSLLSALRRGVYISSVLMIIIAFVL
ncbi:MAG: sodium/proton-translocating pyrophosphatase, partial [Christensenellales bacterium]